MRTTVGAAGVPDPCDGEAMVRPRVTIVVPCYNEVSSIQVLLTRVGLLAIDKEIVVIDNVSTDGTRELLRSLCRNERSLNAWRPVDLGVARDITVMDGPGFTVVLHPMNLGKGASVRLGMAVARGHYIICQDADLEYEPKDILRLLAIAESSKAVAVFGSRLLAPSTVPFDSFNLGRRALTYLFDALYSAELTDVATCYKLIRTDVVRSLRCRASGFDIDFEIPAKLRLAGHDIVEVPISYAPRTVSAGKKIRWRDGVSASFVLVRLRLAASMLPRAGCGSDRISYRDFVRSARERSTAFRRRFMKKS